jgi:hypothetical protein
MAAQASHDVNLSDVADKVVVSPSNVTLKQSESITWNAVGASMVVNVEDDIFTQPVNNVTIPSGSSLTRQLKSRATGSHNYTVSSNGHQPDSLPKMIID